ncbi:WXG100 family type VII secretion target [Streptomyces pinistramenti]|uniref:WXG100 family type VII secretion target n=1 Tax=Streptomyces pinistramenti TaxID=2884812 RepID=UPI001D081B33|nr:WXG100 family type VII secretion target [Streptomyces pinistramenti]MCB5908380.1 WXG100 family type VII secretion target [Streptomyces pinistramenti]
MPLPIPLEYQHHTTRGTFMSGFQAPSQGNFHQYADLTSKQAGHLGDIQRYGDQHCSKDDDLEGILLPLRLLVPKAALYFSGKLAQCHRGMGVIEDKVRRTGSDYATADQQTMADLHSIYPDAISHFPNISALPGASQVADFTDEAVSLKAPVNAEEATTKNIHHQLMLLGMKSELKTADKVFSFLTGQSLIELLLKPVLGDYGRLMSLHDAYDSLGAAVYTVAGTLRKGSWALGSEWKGDTGTAFDSYLFRWTMGIGGVGDAAKIVAKAYKDGYDVVIVLLHQALRALDDLINKEVEQLAKEGAEMLAGDAAIEAVGLGPEDPLADIGAGLYSAYKLYKIYKIVSKIITAIKIIEGIYEGIEKAVKGIEEAVKKVTEALDSPMPTVGSLIDDVEQRGFSFEMSSGWSPAAGAARIGMLPAA